MEKYLNFWGIKQAVFSPKSAGTKGYISHLNAGKVRLASMLAMQPGTLQVVHGGAGVGKTTWLRQMMHSIDASRMESYFYVCNRSPKEEGSMLHGLAHYLRQGVGKGTRVQQHLAIGLEQVYSEGRGLLLGVDAADRAEDARIWHDLASLFDLGAAGGLLPSVVVIGSRTSLNVVRQIPSLSDRLSFAWEFAPLLLKETVAYLDASCRHAGISVFPFHPESAEKIADLSGGYIFAINLLAETCLMQAAEEGVREISPELVASLVAQLENHRQPAKRMPPVSGAKTASN